MIPAAFPLLERGVSADFWEMFFIILQKLAMVLVAPLVLGWCVQHYAKRLCAWIVSIPDLSFYLWSAQLSVLALFLIGRWIGSRLGDEIDGGQASFQKNTALSIWVAYVYLNPVASVGAGCYVLWQNIINSLELWQYRRAKS